MDQLPPSPHPSIITTGLIVISILFPIISALSVALRILAHRKSHQPLHADDYWVIGSWFLTLVLSILVWVYAAKSGINYYNVDFLTGTEYSLELIFISSCYVQFPLAAVKIAVLIFYKRIFSTRIFKRCVWVAIGIVGLWCLVFFFVIFLELDPITFPLTTVRFRFDSTALGLGQVASSFTLDLIVLCLPLPVISRLNMKSERKIALILIFWLGAFCVVAAIVRTVLLDQSIRSVVSSRDQVASQSKQYIFMVLEPNCSILASCLPTYGPLVAGGRAPESIVRSVRSILSLASNNSNHTRKSSRGSAPNVPRDNNAAESQVELQDFENWPDKRQQEASVSSKVSDDAPLTMVPPIHQNEISVTNEVLVYRE
ncbi:uncharacterized protein GGS22DRAFT_166123 [Annulohypoxylon maeteangense]|uniref:uncharacterized protein n=1 Tax=Annulohypoxylon maeteangense TaxID=1927788 RepID=UPI002008B320|nr:uncharacterized protein GGS22DRAFT_166123 [Annulohypoxylon maeteangense]KAI0883800.1 hypothetical protein GGS22DRAFT_166123 [Annulohypoxylon maeteangense]